MKKEFFLVFLALTMISLSAFGGGGSDSSGRSGGQKVAEGADIAEVADIAYLPRRNPGIQRADGSVYALPATRLNPKDESLPPPVYAVSGVRGQPIDETNLREVVDIIITLPAKEKFARNIIEGYDVAQWVLNLPLGLEAQAHAVKKGASTVKIYISGTPEKTVRETITVNIPGEYLKGGTDLVFTSPTEAATLEAWEAKQAESGN